METAIYRYILCILNNIVFYMNLLRYGRIYHSAICRGSNEGLLSFVNFKFHGYHLRWRYFLVKLDA